MAISLYEDILVKLRKDKQEWELSTGQGKGGAQKYDERVGVSKGLARAIDLVMEVATERNEKDDGD